MKRRLLLATFAIYTALLTTMSSSPAKAQFSLPPEVWKTTIDGPQIYNELIRGNYANALQIARDLAVQELRQRLNDGKLVASSLKELAKILNKLFDDPSKTEQQKKIEVLRMVDASLDPAIAPRTGQLGLSLMHSISFGVTRLEWDEKVDYFTCKNINLGGNYVKKYTVQKFPKYTIYRILDGVETKIITIAGGSKGYMNTSEYDPSYGTQAKQSLDKLFPKGVSLKNPPAPDRLMFYDVYADFRPKGTTLQYRIESDDSAYRISDCSPLINRFASTAVADGDGDGKMDYLPKESYLALLRKKLSWLPAVLSLLD